jgi:hypothetical protein
MTQDEQRVVKLAFKPVSILVSGLGGEINAEAEREAAAQAGHPQAQAGAAKLDDISGSSA